MERRGYDGVGQQGFLRFGVLAVLMMLGAAARSQELPLGDAPAQVPLIQIWYGNDQTFGSVGVPQRDVNILGNVSHPSGISSLSYSLNGGATRPLSLGPDSRRLNRPGDFNVDLRYAALGSGSNSLVITAVATSGESAQTTVIVRDASASQWPLPYTVAWAVDQSLMDSSQVVDGKWAIQTGGLRILEPSYDRGVALGDTSWSDYEVTAEVTVSGIDSTSEAFSPTSGGPAVGMLLRWEGHTDTPVFSPPIIQPRSGYLPYGAIGWHHWRTGYGGTDPNQWEVLGNNNIVRDQTTTPVFQYGVPYLLKMQVKTVPGQGHVYKFKAWRKADVEPVNWLMTGVEPFDGPVQGSVLLLAHHVYATFGPVTITPVPDSEPPLITDIAVVAGPTGAVITWMTDEPATSRLLYGLTASYGSSYIDDALVFSHRVELQGLDPEQTYHYKVISTDWSGNASSSNDRTFQTQPLPPPPAPVLALPANGALDQSPALTLVWESASTADRYQVQLSPDSTFAGLTLNDSTITDTARSVSGLAYGTRYFWRVRARNIGGWGLYSSVSRFGTLLPAPQLAFPADGASGIPASVTLRWFTTPSATSYRVQLSTDPTFVAPPVLDDPAVTDTVRAVAGLLNGTTYYWRVRASNALTVGSFSVTRSFVTGLAAPALVAPLDGAQAPQGTVTVRWMSVPLASSYVLLVGSDPTFQSGVVLRDTSVHDTLRSVGGLPSGSRYYWKVAGNNGAGIGPYSSTWSFVTSLPTPALVSPAAGAVSQPVNLSFLWTPVAGATSYGFQLATDSLFNGGLVKNDTSITDTFRTVYGLLQGGVYYWRVQGRNAVATSAYSEIRRLTCAGTLPGVAELIQLPDDATVAADTALFLWKNVLPTATRYWFEIAPDSQFVFRQIDSNVTDTSKVVRGLLPGRRYWWKIRGGNTEGWGPFSETRAFTVLTTDVAPEHGIPTAYVLAQNYPNPFNPETIIEFELPETGSVRLEVFSLLGENVATLVDEPLVAGVYRQRFDASHLPSGVYVYRLLAGGKALMRKMLFVK
jgi:hypothetical protein